VFAPLVFQHAMGTRRVTSSFAACTAVPYLSALSHKRQQFPKKNKHKMPFDFIYKFV
jgi:hypothetical protein